MVPHITVTEVLSFGMESALDLCLFSTLVGGDSDYQNSKTHLSLIVTITSIFLESSYIYRTYLLDPSFVKSQIESTRTLR